MPECLKIRFYGFEIEGETISHGKKGLRLFIQKEPELLFKLLLENCKFFISQKMYV